MEFQIEKLVYGGDGLARLQSGVQPVPEQPGRAQRVLGKAVFIPYTLPGERVEAAIVEQKTGFARGRLDHVLSPSPLRTAPPCPYFAACGGCHYQHTSYEEQLRLKAEILREQLRRTTKLSLELPIQPHASSPLHYRNRARFHLRHRAQFEIGYFRHGSRELLPVRECPISSHLINRVLSCIWELGEAGSVPAGISEIELFADGNDERLLMELYLHTANETPDSLKEFAEHVARTASQIHGIVAFWPGSSRRTAPPLADVLHGSSAIDYNSGRFRYRVSAGAFFQTNRHLVDRMIEIVTGGRNGRLALDLYSGVGLFALPLAQQFERVIAVESTSISAEDLRHNVPQNVKVVSRSAEDYLASAARQRDLHPDLVVVDPPRAGLGTAICKQLSRTSAPELVYVSCDPATLARDLKQLLADGWRASAMHLIDLFPQTFHIETVTILQR